MSVQVTNWIPFHHLIGSSKILVNLYKTCYVAAGFSTIIQEVLNDTSGSYPFLIVYNK
jgi:hypothetical protein